MSIWSFLYNILIGPLNLFFEMVFSVSNKLVSNPGYAIIILSLVINILILPLYNRADKLQKEQRDLEMKIQPGIDHIRKTFKSEERFMMLQTYYRQNGYSPASSLKGAFSLLLEIPFFISAYTLLSGLTLLNGQSFGFIADLGKPDALINLGFMSINILPILMTAINIFSGVVYSKGLRRKDKIQIYGMALIFLVLLYNSPAGLAFYWTLNNIFSLGKNIVKDALAKKNHTKETADNSTVFKFIKSNSKLPFVLSGLYLSILTGLFVPGYLLSSSPIEFFDFIARDNPMKYMLYSFSLALGTFVVWTGLIYALASNKVKCILSMLAPGLAIFFTVNCFKYRGGLSSLSINLASYPNTVISYDASEIMISILILVVALAASCYLFIRMRFALYTIIAVGIAAMGFISFTIISSGNDIYADTSIPNYEGVLDFPLSSTEKNVVVIMLDRAPSYQFENVLKMYPELPQDYDGFTFYPNTASFGVVTNIGSPALFGGYEYIPEISNSRNDIPLEQKHNEALSVMPAVFSDNGYDVTVVDAPYAGYQEISDTSIFDSYENVNAYNTEGRLNPYRDLTETQFNKIKERNMFCYSLLNIAPPFLCNFVYDQGNYHQPERNSYAVQSASSSSEFSGFDYETIKAYSVLDALPSMTRVEDDGRGKVLVLQNLLSHGYSFFEEPDMSMTMDFNNSDDLAGQIVGDSDYQKMLLHVNTAAYKLLGNWFNYLREIGCYDNTRIIIVSDHGFMSPNPEYSISETQNYGLFMPVLLVKDFNSTGFNVSDELMTNADTPYLAMQNLIENPVNPFTGHPISRKWLEGHEYLHLFNSQNKNVLQEIGTTYTPGDWYTVHDDVRDPNNWTYYSSYEEIPQ